MTTPTLARLSFAALVLAAAPFALANKLKGEYRVLLPNGAVLAGKQKVQVAVAPGQVLRVQGRYNDYVVDGDSFGVANFTLTEASPTAGYLRTPIFALRMPLHGQRLTSNVSVEMNGEQLVLTRSGGGITMKIQSKDISQGGSFQMEPSRTIDFRHVLAPGFAYSVDALNRILLRNGTFTVRESPETATLKWPTRAAITGTTESIWTVTAGGRMGIVIGEDATQP